MVRSLRCVVLCAFVLAIVQTLSAQVSTGTILGEVKDETGALVPGAAVTITNTDTNAIRTVTTGDQGEYRVPELLAGSYSVAVQKQGFKKLTQTGLTLLVGQNLVANATLTVGNTQQQVEVTAALPVVDTTSSSLGGYVNSEGMSDLPLNGRNWSNLEFIQPGVTNFRNTGGSAPITTAGQYMSSNGAGIRSNMYTLDGAIMLSLYGVAANSVTGSTLGMDGIQEFKVTTNNFTADMGLTAGSNTALVSKGGTNAFHGDAFDFLRNSSMDARNFFDTAASSGGKRLPPLKRNNYGGTIGGPIRKDKTFFFASLEGIQEEQGLTPVAATIPANCRTATNNPCATLNPANSLIATSIPAGTVNPLIMPFLSLAPLPNPDLPVPNEFSYAFTKPTDETYGEMRLDQTFGSRDTMFVRYTVDDASLSQPTTIPNPDTFDHLVGDYSFTTASYTHIFTSALLDNARVSLSHEQPRSISNTPTYTSIGGTCTGGASSCSFIPGFPQEELGNMGYSGGLSLSASVQIQATNDIWSYSDDLLYTKGRNSLKFGYLGTHWGANFNYVNSTKGSVSYTSLANFLNGDNYLSQTAIYPFNSTNEPEVHRDYVYGTVGVYAQDDMKLTPTFTLNAGLRYEILAPSITDKAGIQAPLVNPLTDEFTTPGLPLLQNPKLNFSPRLGFAWDVFGRGRTALRGGASLMYNVGNLFPLMIEASRGGGTTPNGVGALTAAITPTAGSQKSTCPAGPLTIPLTFPSCFISHTFIGPDYNSKTPAIGTFDLVIDQRLPGDIGLSVAYAGSVGYHLWDFEDGNPCTPSGSINGIPNWIPATVNAGANTECPNGRPNPFWSYMQMDQTVSHEWYNSMQIQAHKERMRNGLEFQASYTLSKNEDEGFGNLPSDTAYSAFFPGYPRALKQTSGSDMPQAFGLQAIYFLPKFSATGLVGGLENGWRVSAVSTDQSGTPFTPQESGDRELALSFASPNALLVPGRTPYSATHGVSTANGINPCPTAGQPLRTPKLWYDPCAFTVQPVGMLGSFNNILRAPGLVDLDMAVAKTTPIRERLNMELRFEAFNVLNHANFGEPTGGGSGSFVVYGVNTNGTDVPTPSPTAGEITQTAGLGFYSSRQIQLSATFTF